MIENRFRQLIIFAIALHIGIELFAWFYFPSDPLEADFYSLDGYGAIFEGNLVTYYLLSLVRLLVLIGLLSFHPVARSLFLLLTIAVFTMSFLWGFRVSAPFIAPFDFLATLVDGAIIALAYYTPVSKRFRDAAGKPTVSDQS